MKSKKHSQSTKPVGLMYDHMIWHTKYNRKVLIHNIRSRCEDIVKEVLNDLHCDMVELNVQPNHVHLLVGIPMTVTPVSVAQKLKSTTSYLLRKEFPTLKTQIPKALWAPSCTHTSCGHDPYAVIQYIKQQTQHHARKQRRSGNQKKTWPQRNSSNSSYKNKFHSGKGGKST